MNIHKNEIVGVLLAGGQALRMGGGDKGLLEIGGKTMIAHVIDRITGQVGGMIINAHGPAQRFSAYGLPIVSDTIGGHVGPLAGVLAGMRWVQEHRADARFIATVSTDAPFLPRDLILRLADALQDEANIALAASGDHVHPVIGLWPVALADDLDDALNDGVRKVLHWTDRHGTIKVDYPFCQIGDRSVDPFFNVNTPEDLKEARQLLEVMEH